MKRERCGSAPSACVRACDRTLGRWRGELNPSSSSYSPSFRPSLRVYAYYCICIRRPNVTGRTTRGVEGSRRFAGCCAGARAPCRHVSGVGCVEAVGGVAGRSMPHARAPAPRAHTLRRRNVRLAEREPVASRPVQQNCVASSSPIECRRRPFTL